MKKRLIFKGLLVKLSSRIERNENYMNLYFLGGAMEIGGSCIYIKIAGKGILLDSGIRQSTSKDPIPDFRTIQEQGGVDAVIISHAHMDHIGTLPIISKAYPNARIYMTAMTEDLTRVLLYDSLKIMKYWEDEIPHYSEKDVLAMLGRIHPIGFHTPFSLFDGFTLTFYPAGHIAGAACIYLVTEAGSLFYSGDFSAFSQRTIEGIRIPKLRPDAAIVETTYGNRLHANRMVEEKRLVELVKECIAQRKKILIPTFALGRAQEVLLILRAAIQNQEIPAVPVFVDGMVRDINRMYVRNPIYLKNALGKRILKGNEPFYTEEIRPVEPMQKREELLTGKDPVILVSSSGMLTGGPSAQYAKLLASLEEACIIITGYQDEESPGRQLLNLLENPEGGSLTIGGSTVPVKCRIEQVGLSAHGDKSEITALVERLSARRVFLVHGNREAMEELGNELAAEDYRRQVYLPECGQEYEIELRNKRKQAAFRLTYTMQMGRHFTAEDEKLLWDYWQEHYEGKLLSVSQIAQIWYGRTYDYGRGIPANVENHENLSRNMGRDEVILERMQEIFLHSNYFAPNARRLFLFEANTKEAVSEALLPKELTMQELEQKIQSIFSGYAYRKIGYHYDRKEVLLQFDYPDSQNIEDFREKAEAFAASTGWAARLNPAMNHNAAGILLSLLFGDRIMKVSYFQDKKYYSVTVNGKSDGNADMEAAKRFQEETGWKLMVNGHTADEAGPAASKTTLGIADREDVFVPGNNRIETTEQNLAFYCIDQTFEGLPHRPDKKSLKQDSQGKYLEISFVSPMIGRQYHEVLQRLSDETGWRICIADKVNQNALFKNIQVICMKHGITPVKNPSYLPEKKMVQVKVQGILSAKDVDAVTEEFRDRTGCGCEVVTVSFADG